MKIEALTFTEEQLNQFPIKTNSGGIWMPVQNNGVYFLQIEARAELETKGIEFTIKEIEIIQNEEI